MEKIDSADLHKHLAGMIDLTEFRVLQPGRVLFDAFFCWALIFISLAAVSLNPSVLTVSLAISLIGTRLYALTIIGHDGVHGQLFEKRWQKELFCSLFIYCPVGLTISWVRGNHLEHHKTLFTDRDPDRPRYCTDDKNNWWSLLYFLTRVKTAYILVNSLFVRNTRASQMGQNTRGWMIVAGWQMCMLSGLTVFLGWWAYPVLWLFPIFLFVFLVSNLRFFAEHSQPEPDELADQHRLISYESNVFERFVFSPLNMNCHAAHHFWPTIPYYYLPMVEKELQKYCAGGEIEWRRSYLGYLRKYISALPIAA